MGKFNGQHFQQLCKQPNIPKPTKNIKKPIKITYIANPTMVTLTSASQFQAIVQQLTGKDSQIIDDSCNPNPNCNINGDQSKNIQMESSIEQDSNGDAYSNNTSSNSTSLVEIDDHDISFWSNLLECFFDFQ